MSKASPSQQQIKSLFNNKAVLYIPGLAIIFGVNEGLLLSQLLYWRGKGHRRDDSFYKTQVELYQETGLSRDKQDRAIKNLKAYGFLVTKNKGVPQKRHFYIDVDELSYTITKLLESDKFRDLNIAPRFAGFQQTITEITQKSTPETTSNITSNVPNPIDQAELINKIPGRYFYDE